MLKYTKQRKRIRWIEWFKGLYKQQIIASYEEENYLATEQIEITHEVKINKEIGNII